MQNNTAFADLMAFQRQTEALGLVAERLGWDQETMMPEGAAEQRGEEMAAMEGVLHARRTGARAQRLRPPGGRVPRAAHRHHRVGVAMQQKKWRQQGPRSRRHTRAACGFRPAWRAVAPHRRERRRR